MIERPLDQISATDLETLVNSRRAEGRRLDFKRAFPGSNERAVKEWLADVSSFANTDGGDIVIGIGDDGNGVASELIGIDAGSLDEGLLRIEDQLRSCLEPRIPACHIHTVALPDDRVALVVRIGASLLAPHRITYKNSGRFFARNSRGKFELDTGELRLAFAATDETPRKLRDLHARAIAATTGADMPCRLADGPAAILTIAPMSVLRDARDISVTRENAVLPPNMSGYSYAIGLDGVVMYAPVDEETQRVPGWALNHRRGYVDFAWSIGRVTKENGPLVWRKRFEEGLFESTRSAIIRLNSYGLQGPWIAMVTIKGAAGFRILLGDHYPTSHVWQDPAYLGEIIDDLLAPESLTPFVERFWRLFGMERTPA